MAVKTTVVHSKKEPYDVYIGRPGPWGNRFKVGPDGTRSEVLQKYFRWLLGHPDYIQRARVQLRGKVLGCWCKPKACHGDILALLTDHEAQ